MIYVSFIFISLNRNWRNVQISFETLYPSLMPWPEGISWMLTESGRVRWSSGMISLNLFEWWAWIQHLSDARDSGNPSSQTSRVSGHHTCPMHLSQSLEAPHAEWHQPVRIMVPWWVIWKVNQCQMSCALNFLEPSVAEERGTGGQDYMQQHATRHSWWWS